MQEVLLGSVCSAQTFKYANSDVLHLRLFTGPGVLDYTYHPEDHKCKKDLLLGRTKHAELPTWKLIRPRPTKNQYMGPYYICKGACIVLLYGLFLTFCVLYTKNPQIVLFRCGDGTRMPVSWPLYLCLLPRRN